MYNRHPPDPNVEKTLSAFGERDSIVERAPRFERSQVLQIVISLGDQAEQNCAVYHDLMPKSTLTRHLKVLREAGVTKVRIEGTQLYDSLRTEELEQLFPGLMLPC
jgi:DNA-binding transcriptional ArsR family regulator